MTTRNGGKGRDTYDFKIGDGAVTVVNTGGEGAAQDTVKFGSRILGFDWLWFEKSGNDLKVSVLSTDSDSITVKDWYAGRHNQLTFELHNGDRLSWSGAEELATEMQVMTRPVGAGASWAVMYGDHRRELDGIVTARSFKESGAFPDKRGGPGNDWIYGAGTASLLMNGLGGDDVLIGGPAGDTLNGGDGADRLFGNGGNDTLNGGGENDVLYGGEGKDTLKGGDGKDELHGGNGNDYLEGGPGDDTLYGGEGKDVLRGGAGADKFDGGGVNGGGTTVFYDDAPDGVTVDLTMEWKRTGAGDWQQKGDAAGDTYHKIRRVRGSEHNDRIRGTEGVNVIRGRGGDDEIYGLGGRDRLIGNGGADSLYGGADGDWLFGVEGANTLEGGAGDDWLYGGSGRDTYKFDAGDDVDTVVNAGGEGAAQDTVKFGPSISFDNLWFERSGNDLKVSALSIQAGRDDSITVKDWYVSGPGQWPYDNRLTFEFTDKYPPRRLSWSGADALVKAMEGKTRPTGIWTGKDGEDWTKIVNDHSFAESGAAPGVSGGPGNDWIYGKGPGSHTMNGLGGDDVLIGGPAGDTLNGGDGDDRLFGSDGDDKLYGGDGRDKLYGGDGDDKLYGEAGQDYLDGGPGNDTLYSGGDGDVLRGGAGGDAFHGRGDGAAPTVFYDDAPDGVTVDLKTPDNNTGHAAGDTYYEIRRVRGSEHDDRIRGNDEVNVIRGSGGDDKLYGRGGNDMLRGGAGNDWLEGGAGDDYWLEGGSGRDTYSFDAGDGADTVVNAGGEGAAQDTVKFGPSISFDNLWFERSGNDLKVSALSIQAGRDDSITVKDWYVSGPGQWPYDNRLTFEFTDKYPPRRLSWSGADALVKAMEGKTRPTGIWTGKDGEDWTKIVNDHSFAESGAFPARSSGSGNVWFYGEGSGSHTFESGGGDDVLIGGPAGDTLKGGDGDDRLFGSDGDDKLYGGDGRDKLYGGDGKDELHGGPGQDYLDGGDGDDTLMAGEGGDVLRGGAGGDKLIAGVNGAAPTVFYDDAPDGVVVDLKTPGNNTGYAAGDEYINIRRVRGSEHDDRIRGNDEVNVIRGSGGDDKLYGRGGNDMLRGGAGNDWLEGGAGDDYWLEGGSGRDTYSFDAGDGADTVVNAGEGAAQDTVEFGPGILSFNWLWFERSGDDLKVSVLTTAAGDSGGSITVKDWYAGQHNQLTFKLGNKRLSWSGADALATKMEAMTRPSAGPWTEKSLNDIVTAKSLRSGAAPDVRGGSGNDWIYGAGTVSHTIDGFGGDDVLIGGLAGDTLKGGDGADRLFGNDGDDKLYGGDGRDKLYGGDGDDTLEGGAGNDYLDGGLGNDTLKGGEGKDVLRGGAGADKFDGGGVDGGGTTVYYDDAPDGVTVDLKMEWRLTGAGEWQQTGHAKGDQYTKIRRVRGSEHNDRIRGTEGVNVIRGSGGDDEIYGLGGRDRLIGNGGADSLYGGADGDWLFGVEGADTLDGGAGNDWLEGGAGDDTLTGGKGADVYKFGRGGDADTVDNTGDDSGGESAASDTVRFGSGIDADQLWFARSGDDLRVSIVGTTDSITVKDWYDGTTTQRVGFELSNGQLLTRAGAEELVIAMAAMTQPTGADASEWTSTQYDTLKPIMAPHGWTVTS